MQIVYEPTTLMELQKPGQGMIVVGIESLGNVGYQFLIDEIGNDLISDIAADTRLMGTVRSVYACAGYECGTLVTGSVSIKSGESVYMCVLKALRSAQKSVVRLEIERDSGWVACKDKIELCSAATLHMDLVKYVDLHLVRGLVNLSGELITRIEQSCPDDVVRKGLDAVLKYLKFAPDV